MSIKSEQVWSRIEKINQDGDLVRLRIQDCPKDHSEEVLNLLVNHFAKDEVVLNAVGIPKNPQSINEYTEYLKAIFNDPNHRIVICCSDDYNDVQKIAGVSLIILTNKRRDWGPLLKASEVLSEETKRRYRIFHEVSQMYDILEQQNVNSFYDDRAMLVLPQYRKIGIAQELFKVRRLMCQAHGVPLTAAWMTSFGSQKSAEKDGWESVYEVNYEDLGRRHGVTFTDVPPTMKLMVAKAAATKDTE